MAVLRARNHAWYDREREAEIINKNGTMLSIINTSGEVNWTVLVFSQTSPRPEFGDFIPGWDNTGTSPVTILPPSGRAPTYAGTSADGHAVYAYSSGAGGVYYLNPEDWADAALPQGEDLGTWISQHTKKQIENLALGFKVKFNLYRYNDLFEIRWAGDPAKFGPGKTWNGSNTVIDFRIAETFVADVEKDALNFGGNKNYDDVPKQFTWADCAKYAKDKTWLQNILELGFEKWLGMEPDAQMVVYCRAKTTNGAYATDWARFVIHANGDAEGYGGDDSQVNVRPKNEVPVGQHTNKSPTSSTESSDFDDDGSAPAVTGASILTTSYALTAAQTRTFGDFLWTNSFLENVQLLNFSPIENVVSCKLFPYPMSGIDSALKIAAVQVPDLVVKKIEATNADNYKIEYPEKYIAPEGNEVTFLDHQTMILLYLPFIGYKELDPRLCMDRWIKISYVVDIVTGQCQVTIRRAVTQNGNYHAFMKFTGECAFDIPITSSNRAQIEGAIAQNLMSGMFSLATGNVAGTVSSAFGAMNTAVFSQIHYQTEGAPNPICELFDNMKPFLMYARPHYQNDASFLQEYAHTVGHKCNMDLTLGGLSGYTKCIDVDVEGLTGTQDEKMEVKKLLETGVLL